MNDCVSRFTQSYQKKHIFSESLTYFNPRLVKYPLEYGYIVYNIIYYYYITFSNALYIATKVHICIKFMCCKTFYLSFISRNKLFPMPMNLINQLAQMLLSR